MDKGNANREQTGPSAPADDTDTQRTNEVESRQSAEQARERAGETARPGGDGMGMYSEGTRAGRARALRRAHHAGRVRDEFGGVRGKTK